jgi:hypothetical protein
MNPVTLNPVFFDLLKSLSSIRNQFPIEKQSDGRFLTSNLSESTSIAFYLKTSPEIFSFENENNKIAFENFNEFHSFIGLFGENYSVSVDDMSDFFTISEGDSELEYNLGFIDTIVSEIPNYPVREDDINNGYRMVFTQEFINRVRGIINRIGGKTNEKRITFNISGSDLEVVFSSTAHNTKFSQKFEGIIESFGEPELDSFIVTDEVFGLLPNLPDDFERTLTIGGVRGAFIFEYKSKESEDLHLEIITARIR